MHTLGAPAAGYIPHIRETSEDIRCCSREESHMRMAAGTFESTLDENCDFRMTVDLDSMEVQG